MPFVAMRLRVRRLLLLGVAWEVSLQEHIPPERLARVYSFDALASFLAIPVGQVVAGPVAIALGPRTAMIAAAGMIALAVAAMLASRGVRTLAHVVPPAADRTSGRTSSRPAVPEPVSAAAGEESRILPDR